MIAVGSLAQRMGARSFLMSCALLGAFLSSLVVMSICRLFAGDTGALIGLIGMLIYYGIYVPQITPRIEAMADQLERELGN